MTNNSGDMTNNISDERLKELIKTNDKESRFGRNGYYADIGNARAELLSARETIRRLVEVGRAMRNDVYAFRAPLPHTMIFNSTDLWDALLAELEGTPPKLADLKGIAPNCTGNKSSEDFVRDMRDEWDNEELEGKGPQLTESHGK